MPHDVIFYGPVLGAVGRDALGNRLPHEALRVAVDGGSQAPVRFDLWCGDGDSGQPPEGVAAKWKISQDETDLSFALNHISNHAWQTLHLAGFLGGRKDHELAVFGELYRLIKTNAGNTAIFYDQLLDPCIQLVSQGSHTLAIDGPFSVLALEETLFSLSGACKYSTTELSLPPLSGRGISNFATGKIQITCSHPVFIFGNLIRS